MPVQESHLYIPPGEVGIRKQRIHADRCRRTARIAGPMALLKNDDRALLHPWRYGSHNYAGQYGSRNCFPAHVQQVTEELEEDFPEDFNEISVLRSRIYRAGYSHEGDHVDSTFDYRHIIIIGGRGLFLHRSRFSATHTAISEPVEIGDVITLNNTVPNARRMHRIVPQGHIEMLVYGKINTENLVA